MRKSCDYWYRDTLGCPRTSRKNGTEVFKANEISLGVQGQNV